MPFNPHVPPPLTPFESVSAFFGELATEISARRAALVEPLHGLTLRSNWMLYLRLRAAASAIAAANLAILLDEMMQKSDARFEATKERSSHHFALSLLHYANKGEAATTATLAIQIATEEKFIHEAVGMERAFQSLSGNFLAQWCRLNLNDIPPRVEEMLREQGLSMQRIENAENGRFTVRGDAKQLFDSLVHRDVEESQECVIGAFDSEFPPDPHSGQFVAVFPDLEMLKTAWSLYPESNTPRLDRAIAKMDRLGVHIGEPPATPPLKTETGIWRSLRVSEWGKVFDIDSKNGPGDKLRAMLRDGDAEKINNINWRVRVEALSPVESDRLNDLFPE